MQSIILAAGKGSRIREINGNKPKCLNLVGDKTIIERQIDALLSCGISDIIVVTGYMYETLEGYLKERYDTIRFI